MAIARKPQKPAAAAARKSTPAVVAAVPVTEVKAPVPPALEEPLDAAIGKAEEVQEQVSRAAEQGAEQTRLVYERLKTVSEEATGSLESSYAAASKGLSEFNMKAIEAFKVNSEATFEFMKALLASKSLSEAITLQSEHTRSQLETLNAQVKDLGSIAKRVASETVEPIKTTLSKTMHVST